MECKDFVSLTVKSRKHIPAYYDRWVSVVYQYYGKGRNTPNTSFMCIDGFLIRMTPQFPTTSTMLEIGQITVNITTQGDIGVGKCRYVGRSACTHFEGLQIVLVQQGWLDVFVDHRVDMSALQRSSIESHTQRYVYAGRQVGRQMCRYFRCQELVKQGWGGVFVDYGVGMLTVQRSLILRHAWGMRCLVNSIFLNRAEVA